MNDTIQVAEALTRFCAEPVSLRAGLPMKAIGGRRSAIALLVSLVQAPLVAQGPWTQLAPATSPPSRASHAMAYDSTRQRTVLFGGSNGTSMSDTWEWDGFNWLQQGPAASPAGRRDHALAYDAARQRTVLFGGSPDGSTSLGDTWEWDGVTWAQRTPLMTPPPRRKHAMAYDSARQRVVLFGGLGNFNPLGDTWEWDGSNWTAKFTVNYPPARQGHAMVYDEVRHRLVLFGGASNGANPFLGDTWEMDGTNWLHHSPAASPSPRLYHAMAYEPAQQLVVLFGGADPLSSLSDTWEWNGITWAQQTSGSSPMRVGHAMAYDGARQRAVLFGGVSGLLPPGQPFLGDTWIHGSLTVPASATPYGAGCGSPPLGLVPDPAGRPLLGHVASATIVNATTVVGAVAAGLNNQFYGPFALPVTLGGIGMTGCDLWQSADVLGLPISPLTPTTLSFSLALPNAPAILGSHVYLQAYVLAPGVNPLQITLSNAVDWLLGNV